jgi:hypothetical protein
MPSNGALPSNEWHGRWSGRSIGGCSIRRNRRSRRPSPTEGPCRNYSFAPIRVKKRTNTCRAILRLLAAIAFPRSRALPDESAPASTRRASTSRPHITGTDSVSQLARSWRSFETQVQPFAFASSTHIPGAAWRSPMGHGAPWPLRAPPSSAQASGSSRHSSPRSKKATRSTTSPCMWRRAAARVSTRFFAGSLPKLREAEGEPARAGPPPQCQCPPMRRTKVPSTCSNRSRSAASSSGR